MGGDGAGTLLHALGRLVVLSALITNSCSRCQGERMRDDAALQMGATLERELVPIIEGKDLEIHEVAREGGPPGSCPFPVAGTKSWAAVISTMRAWPGWTDSSKCFDEMP